MCARFLRLLLLVCQSTNHADCPPSLVQFDPHPTCPPSFGTISVLINGAIDIFPPILARRGSILYLFACSTHPELKKNVFFAAYQILWKQK